MDNKIEKELLKLSDEKYREFHRRIINDDSVKLIGIRTPIMRDYAKKLSKENDLDYYIKIIPENYYEELMIKGMLIGLNKKLTVEELKEYIDYFVPKVTNWALCDTFVSSLKITKKYKKEMWNVIKKYLKSKKEFDVRFALVMILNYYIDDDYIDEIYKIINNVKLEYYYVKMANAWLISYCFINYYDKTVDFYKTNCKIDVWTYNKGIQKSLESYRLTTKQKEELKKIRKDVEDA